MHKCGGGNYTVTALLRVSFCDTAELEFSMRLEPTTKIFEGAEHSGLQAKHEALGQEAFSWEPGAHAMQREAFDG